MKLLTALALALALPSAGHAEAQYVIRRAVEAGQLKPLAEILAGIQKTYPGKVLDVDLESDLNGRRIYEVTLLGHDAQRTKLLVDAVSGKVLPHTGALTPALDMAGTLRKLLATHPGKVLELELKRSGDQRLIYEVQLILANGQLREFVIDARNGELLDDTGHRRAELKQLISLPDLLTRLPPLYRGLIHEIELEYDQDGRYFYEVEVRLDDGRVFELDVDAISGKVLSGEEIEQ